MINLHLLINKMLSAGQQTSDGSTEAFAETDGYRVEILDDLLRRNVQLDDAVEKPCTVHMKSDFSRLDHLS